MVDHSELQRLALIHGIDATQPIHSLRETLENELRDAQTDVSDLID